jgi:hypothetical protein
MNKISRDYLKIKVAEHQIDELIEEMFKLLTAYLALQKERHVSEIYDSLILVTGKYKSIKHENILGIIDPKDFTIESNKIGYSLLSIINSIPDIVFETNIFDTHEIESTREKIKKINATDDFKYDIFLSFSSKDLNEAKTLAEALRGYGLRVFISDEALKSNVGTSFFEKIDYALNNSKNFILFVTAFAMQSEWVKTEYETFYNEYFIPHKGQRKFIIFKGADFEQATVPSLLKRLQFANSINEILESFLEQEDLNQQTIEEKRRKAQEELEMKAVEEKRRKAQEELEMKAVEEKRRKAQEELEMKAVEEKRRKAQEELEMKAVEEKRRKAQEKLEQKAIVEKRQKAQVGVSPKIDSEKIPKKQNEAIVTVDTRNKKPNNYSLITGIILGTIVVITGLYFLLKPSEKNFQTENLQKGIPVTKVPEVIKKYNDSTALSRLGKYAVKKQNDPDKDNSTSVPENNLSAAEKMLVGTRPFGSHWIEPYGKATIVKKGNKLQIEGRQLSGSNKNYCTISGEIEITNDRNFTLNGTIDLYYLSSGFDDIKKLNGKFVFRRFGDRPYWRLKQPETSTGYFKNAFHYIDIFMK